MTLLYPSHSLPFLSCIRIFLFYQIPFLLVSFHLLALSLSFYLYHFLCVVAVSYLYFFLFIVSSISISTVTLRFPFCFIISFSSFSMISWSNISAGKCNRAL
ncbi:hypothetical protein F4604DRAFT_873816 [Suillus subluteus]|nr:hypothetical protein F4604DRAFT_873816 [Suillus subluteus]